MVITGRSRRDIPEYEIADAIWRADQNGVDFGDMDVVPYICEEYGYDVATIDRQKVDKYFEEIAWRESWA